MAEATDCRRTMESWGRWLQYRQCWSEWIWWEWSGRRRSRRNSTRRRSCSLPEWPCSGPRWTRRCRPFDGARPRAFLVVGRVGSSASENSANSFCWIHIILGEFINVCLHYMTSCRKNNLCPLQSSSSESIFSAKILLWCHNPRQLLTFCAAAHGHPERTGRTVRDVVTRHCHPRSYLRNFK